MTKRKPRTQRRTSQPAGTIKTFGGSSGGWHWQPAGSGHGPARRLRTVEQAREIYQRFSGNVLLPADGSLDHLATEAGQRPRHHGQRQPQRIDNPGSQQRGQSR